MRANSYQADSVLRTTDQLSDEELLAWLKLARVYVGRAPEAIKLIAAFELPEAVFEAPRALVRKVTGEENARRLFSQDTELEAQSALTWLRRTPTADVVLVTDADYPQELIATESPEVLFFCRGRRDVLRFPRLTVLVTAKADSEGRRNLQDFCRTLSNQGIVCVMPVENEVDKMGVLATLEAGGGGLILSASGPDRVTNPSCLDVWQVTEQQGLILTAEFPGQGATDSTRKRREFFLAALSRGVLVIETERRGTALDVARRAAELGRDVAALPGSIHSPLYKGNHLLIRQGAKLTESLEDLVKDFGLDSD